MLAPRSFRGTPNFHWLPQQLQPKPSRRKLPNSILSFRISGGERCADGGANDPTCTKYCEAVALSKFALSTSPTPPYSVFLQLGSVCRAPAANKHPPVSISTF